MSNRNENVTSSKHVNRRADNRVHLMTQDESQRLMSPSNIVQVAKQAGKNLRILKTSERSHQSGGKDERIFNRSMKIISVFTVLIMR